MSSLEKLPVRELVKLLLEKGITAFEEGQASGSIEPQKLEFFAWRMDDFGYSKEGVTSHSAKGETFQKEFWFGLIDNVKSYLYSLDLYHTLKSKITEKIPNQGIDELDHLLQMFLQKFSYGEINSSDVDLISKSFEDHLEGKTIRCGANVEFLGLAIEPDIIDLQNGIVLRQTKKEDVEKEVESYMRHHPNYDPNLPSMIMKITMDGRNAIDVQDRVSDAEAILRLFKVASTRSKGYTFFSGSFNSNFGGIFGTLDKTRPSIVGCIEKYEIDDLKKFWNSLKERVVIFTRLGEHSSYRDIAYQRYKDAILKNSESVERRVADCMMGLEAIFLKDHDEQAELSYRLQLRTGKLLGILGHDPFKIKNLVRDGYKIRSKFVHGSTLDHKDVRKYEEKYEKMDEFLLKILDLLRIAIVVSLMMTIKKEKILDLIDDSFLDNTKETELRNFLRESIEILKI